MSSCFMDTFLDGCNEAASVEHVSDSLSDVMGVTYGINFSAFEYGTTCNIINMSKLLRPQILIYMCVLFAWRFLIGFRFIVILNSYIGTQMSWIQFESNLILFE